MQLHAAFEDVVRLGLENEVRTCDLQTLLHGAERNILTADLRGERHPRIGKIAMRLGHERVRLLNAPADSAEYVDLPRCVKTRPERVAARIGIHSGGTVLAHVRAGVRPYSRDVRHDVRPRPGIAPASLFKALLRHQERAVVRHCVLYETRKQLVVELAPPCADILCLKLCARIGRFRGRLELPRLGEIGGHRPTGAWRLEGGFIDRHFG